MILSNLRRAHISLMISVILFSQLFYDGHQNFAQELAASVDQEATAISPSDRLMNITAIGIQHEHGEKTVTGWINTVVLL